LCLLTQGWKKLSFQNHIFDPNSMPLGVYVGGL
jgi:hypothetical protein